MGLIVSLYLLIGQMLCIFEMSVQPISYFVKYQIKKNFHLQNFYFQ